MITPLKQKDQNVLTIRALQALVDETLLLGYELCRQRFQAVAKVLRITKNYQPTHHTEEACSSIFAFTRVVDSGHERLTGKGFDGYRPTLWVCSSATTIIGVDKEN